jgi:chorismate mutase
MANTLFRGSRRLIDSDTGEIIETQVIEKSIEAGDSGFHKIWLSQILELVEEVGNAKMRVLMWLLSNADRQNQIQATIKEIAAGSGVGSATVERLMAALVKADVITRPKRYGPWRLNPQVIFSGSHQQRMNVMIRYRDESQTDMFEEQPPAVTASVTPIRKKAA